jgi:uncharacterized protein YkwD
VDRSLARADFSNAGEALDLVAPGVSINSIVPGGEIQAWSGTSMATPHVAGALAVLLGGQVDGPVGRAALQSTAIDRGALGFDSLYGWGSLDVGAASGAPRAPDEADGPRQLLSLRVGQRVGETDRIAACGSFRNPCARPKTRRAALAIVAAAPAGSTELVGMLVRIRMQTRGLATVWRSLPIRTHRLRSASPARFSLVQPGRVGTWWRIRVDTPRTATTLASRSPWIQFRPRTAFTSPLELQEIVAMACINKARRAAGHLQLGVDVRLLRAARWMSNDMVANDRFSHTDSRGRSLAERLEAFSYPNSKWRGELLAAGQVTGEDVVAAWMASPPHRSVLLRPETRALGIARRADSADQYEQYWTVDVGGATPKTPVRLSSPAVCPTGGPEGVVDGIIGTPESIEGSDR